MTYQVLARKWRPKTFADMVGQQHVVRALGNALDRDQLHHAYLFTGTRGVGKTTLARILAKALNCEQGVSSTPCGTCGSCTEIDAGRFVDLLEVDAASRTKVDQTRELLENVPYAPVRGRYKVYLIDEVHMFSEASFNALLKTLEEPPPHVKFLLATTDPQKVPVTVLSRCLQLHLRHLEVGEIAGQFQRILEAEGIEAEPDALALLARAAQGSMRDGLSLLDQAIAFGAGRVRAEDVAAMLGVGGLERLPDLIAAVAAGDAAEVLALIAGLADRTPDFARLLRELLVTLHRVALLQTLDRAADPGWGDLPALRRLAQRLTPEDTQLYYQIALIGGRDLPLAPDARGGFEMTLLRMLAFRPGAASAAAVAVSPLVRAAPPPSPSSGPATAGYAPTEVGIAPTRVAEPPPRPVAETPLRQDTPPQGAPVAPGEWNALLPRLGLKGLAAELAKHCTLRAWDKDLVELALDPAQGGLAGPATEARLREALQAYCGRPVRLKIALQAPAAGQDTPARRAAREQDERRAQTLTTLRADPLVRGLAERFDAELIEDSLRFTDD
jgi:DNA polymerase-3 subunit gamma/tau